MLVPYKWMAEYVPGLPPPEDVAEALTSGGTACESIDGDKENPIFNFEITHDRADCLSILGIAREAAAIFGLRLKHPKLFVDEEENMVNELATVKIISPDLCKRYVARVITEVNIGQSPQWMQRKLLSCGIRPVNNVVDVTNYVMLELGQPLHAFDLDLIKDGKLVVRRARDGESIITIDEETRELSEDMLVISNDRSPVAIAGVMGGISTEVTESTTQVLLEAATFDSVSIWRTSSALKMRTEASIRFSRGMWPDNAGLGIARATALISDLGIGKTATSKIDEYPRFEPPLYIRLRPARVNRLLGITIDPDEIKLILMRLGFILDEYNDSLYRVLIPSHRMDVTQEEDLVEEVARIYGYDRIPPSIPRGLPPVIQLDPRKRLISKIGEVLRGGGLTEVNTITFTSEAACYELGFPKETIDLLKVGVRNPISKDHTMLRTTLLVSLIDILKRNASRQRNDVAVYEVGKVFQRQDKTGSEEGSGEGDTIKYERKKVGLALMGKLREPTWGNRAVDVDFFDIKGIIEALFENLGIRRFRLKKEIHPSLHPGRTATVIIDGENVGYFGELHPSINEALGLKKRAYLAELDLDRLIDTLTIDREIKEIPRFPAITRDLAVIVKEDIENGIVEETIWEAGANLIEHVNLFDVYKGSQIPAGHKSLAYSITYRSLDATLTDEEVEKVHTNIIKSLALKTGASIRS
ncbi:MAG: phenylalanine--tRNA ligase subunit beta [Firmicutes bacterium]|nr:phenylalanine--tRNA ligase subunit beta [Bacillota bacterium]